MTAKCIKARLDGGLFSFTLRFVNFSRTQTMDQMLMIAGAVILGLAICVVLAAGMRLGPPH